VLAQALAPRVRVNAVAPGPTIRNPRQSDAHFKKQAEATPLGRGATPEEVANAVRYLIDSKAITGATLPVDGGQHLIWKTADVVGTEP
jgi:NAD(P)-dependent dehydrogenase (short-subunit alcohol dehydrogenase family)